MQLRPTESGTPVDEAGSDPTPLPAVIPPVVVVMVTHDPGPWFEETLASLADQTYPDLGFLVIDTASAETARASMAFQPGIGGGSASA